MDEQRRQEAALPRFSPRTVTPPAEPLRPLPFIRALVRNPISAWSERVYREQTFVSSPLGAPVAYVCDPEEVRRILVSEVEDFPKAPVNKRILSPSLGDGILTSEGAAWRWQRRTVAPMFRPADIMGLVPVMVRAAEETLSAWRSAGTDAVRSIDEAMMALTLRVIVESMMSGAKGFEPEFVGRMLHQYLQPTSWLVFYDLISMPEWMPYPGRRRLRASASAMRAAVAAIVARRRTEAGSSAAREGRSSGGDLLDRLMAARDPETGAAMSEASLVDNILTFLMAGHETTAVALSWTLSLLAQAPAWQEKVRAEIREVCADGPVTAAHLDRLVVTERVAKEAMRLFPPAALIVRIAAKPTSIGGTAIPAGTRVLVPIYAIHRHHTLWEAPSDFDPDRFLPEREAARHRFAYLPFGAGPRICVGMAFAYAEMKAVLAVLLRGARFETTGAPQPLPLLRVTLRPEGGLALRVRVGAP